jgi:hypothetical protein
MFDASSLLKYKSYSKKKEKRKTGKEQIRNRRKRSSISHAAIDQW